VSYYRLRAEAYAELGRWNDAAKDLERAAELADQPSCFQPVLLLVTAGDMEGYRRACARLYEQFGQSDDPKIADWLAWICKFGPEAIDDLGRALEFAERAVASDPGSVRYHNDYAGVLYRAGRYQEAAAEINEAVRLRGGEGAVWDWIWLAMIHDHLGEADKARQWLDKACSWIDQSLASQSWTARIELQLLRREAEELISQTPQGKKPAPDGEKPTHEEGQTEEKVKSEP
jgi:tetratricopeptide (TPR) repeat protein